MFRKYILFNSLAGGGKCKEEAENLASMCEGAALIDMSKITSYKTFLDGLDTSDSIIVCGGDGTLNRFANDIKGIELRNEVYYYPVGTGNDFARDLGKAKNATPDFCINEYLKELPSVTVNGETKLFINGVGFGIDGYCCEEGDRLREINARENKEKPVNYTMIAIKGLLFKFKPVNAKVTVDGKEYKFKKVWIAPTMKGRYYGGGMMPTPNQNRLDDAKNVSAMIFHGTGKLKTLMIFPSIFNGGHVKHTEAIEVLSGKEITVEFDRPASLQIDGETVLGVTKYSVKSEVFSKV